MKKDKKKKRGVVGGEVNPYVKKNFVTKCNKMVNIYMPDLTNPIFFNETKARAHLESLRWAGGRFCPHCGESEKTAPVAGKKHRPGLYYCNACKGTFTATVGTIFERSKIPLHKWMAGFHLMAASKKGISAHQLHRMLKLTYKTAWFMAHRIREAMTDEKRNRGR